MKKLYLLLLPLLISLQGFSQFYEGFEGETFPPAGWLVTDNGVGTANSWVKSNFLPNTGNWSAYMDRENVGMGNTSQDWLISPQLYLGTNSLLKFSSRTTLAGNQGTLYQIRFSSSPNQNNLSSYTVLQTYTENDLNTIYSNYEEKIIDLSALAGQSVYLAFVMIYTQPTNALGGDRWHLDDINITEPLELILNAFVDLNNNGVKDAIEPNFPHGSFNYQVNLGNVIVANGSNGSHSIFVSDVTNSYNLNHQINPNYAVYFSSATSYTNISVAAGSVSTTYYFPITPLQPYSDVQVNIIGNNPPPRPGFTYINTIVYKNNGYQTIPSGTITFTKDAAVTITNISQTGTTATTNGFTYDYTNLGPFETRSIQVTMQVPVIPTVSLGDILANSVSITPNPDVIVANNESNISQVIVGSYDPNDKMESRGPEIDIDTFTANDYLYYTIRFENTGTAAAEFIRIEDTLHADLNPSTFEMIHASHTYNVTRNGNALVWHFFDINLPPTIQNPVLSQGYVYFRIKPNPGFAIGDIIPNTAEIYFDYNPAIITNTFETEFVETLSTTDFNFATISMYPNPTTSMLNFNSNETIKEIIVYDLLGNQVLIKNTSDNAISLDVSNLSKGMYLIKFINAENNHTVRKFIKN